MKPMAGLRPTPLFRPLAAPAKSTSAAPAARLRIMKNDDDGVPAPRGEPEPEAGDRRPETGG